MFLFKAATAAQQINNEEDLSIDNLNDNTNTRQFIEGEQIFEARRGKSVTMSCIVHNVKNYKVSLDIFLFFPLMFHLNEL